MPPDGSSREVVLRAGDPVDLAVASERGSFLVTAVHADHLQLVPLATRDAVVLPTEPRPAVLFPADAGDTVMFRGLVVASADRADAWFAGSEAAPARPEPRAARIAIQIPVKVADVQPGGWAVFGETENLSVTGLLARVDDPVPAADEVVVVLRLPERVLRISAVPVRRTRTHAAFSFPAVDPEARLLIVRLLARPA